MNNCYHFILLLRSHLVVGGEAEAAAEDVRAYVLTGAGDVGVGAAPTIAFRGDEGVCAIDASALNAARASSIS